MHPLTRHLQKTADKLDDVLGWTVGHLIIDPDRAYIQRDTGDLVPIPQNCRIEVRSEGQWQAVPVANLTHISADGWPLYAGLDARMKGGV